MRRGLDIGLTSSRINEAVPICKNLWRICLPCRRSPRPQNLPNLSQSQGAEQVRPNAIERTWRQTHIWKSMEVVQVWASKWQIGRGLGVPRRIDKKVRTPSLKCCKALQSIAEVLHFLPQVFHHITKVSHSLPRSEEPRGVATCQNCPQREVSRSTCKSGTKAETSVLWPLGHYHYASTSIFC